MIKPAAFFGSYVDAKFMRGLKVMRVSVDVPIEKSGEFIELFGVPDGANPVPVALARLVSAPSGAEGNGLGVSDAPAAIGTHAEPAKDQDKPRTPFKDLPRSQQAAIKCQDPEFQKWVYSTIIAPRVVGEPIAFFDDEPAEWTNQTIKSYLGIKSKTELDQEGPKALAFDRLITDFDLRNTVRA